MKAKNKIEITHNKFTYRNISYDIERIAHIGWKVSDHIDGFSVANLKIYLSRPNAVVKLNSKARALFNSEVIDKNIQTFNHFKTVYSKLSRMSFQQRLESYVQEFEDKGYFTYSGYRFHFDGGVSKISVSQKIFNIYEDTVYLREDYPFSLILRKGEQDNLLKTMKKYVSTKYVDFYIDRYVIHYLFKSLYNYQIEEAPIYDITRPYKDLKNLISKRSKICPYCKEKIKTDAIKCKHCGSMLNDPNTNKA